MIGESVNVGEEEGEAVAGGGTVVVGEEEEGEGGIRPEAEKFVGGDAAEGGGVGADVDLGTEKEGVSVKVDVTLLEALLEVEGERICGREEC